MSLLRFCSFLLVLGLLLPNLVFSYQPRLICEMLLGSGGPRSHGLKLRPKVNFEDDVTTANFLREFLPSKGSILELSAGTIAVEVIDHLVLNPDIKFLATDISDEFYDQIDSELSEHFIHQLGDRRSLRRSPFLNTLSPKVSSRVNRLSPLERESFRESPVEAYLDIISPQLQEFLPANLEVRSDFDNSEALPFPDSYFDGLVMTRGLCDCHSRGPLCGGIAANSRDLSRFFLEVGRVLNATNPRATAVLQGCYFDSIRLEEGADPLLKINDLERAIKIFERRYPYFQVRYLELLGGFYGGLVISR